MKLWHDEPLTRADWFWTGVMWATFLACALLIIVPAFASIKQAGPACHITGLVYATDDLAEVAVADVSVPFGCPIRAQRFERRLVLTSPYWYVEIEIPRAGGWMRFAYTWGGDTAYIGPRAVKITNGPLVGG